MSHNEFWLDPVSASRAMPMYSLLRMVIQLRSGLPLGGRTPIGTDGNDVAKKKKGAIQAEMLVNDLSPAVAGSTDNTIFRTTAKVEVSPELERLHAKFGDLDVRYQASKAHSRALQSEVRRYRWTTRAVITGGSAKAIYGMTISAWMSDQWRANCALLAGMIIAIGWLAMPTAREMIKMARKSRNV